MSEPTFPPSAPQGTPSRRLFFRVFPSLMLPMFLGVVDQTIVATALPAISSSLGDVERMSWIVVGYLIANTVAAPVYGRLGDVFGRKRMMFVALGVMVAASALCAAAGSILTLTLARVLQGLGGGGLMTMAQSLIGEAVPPRERARYQGYISAVIVSSNAFGPVVGGYLTAAFGWRSIFLINIPLGLAAAVAMRRLPSHAPKHGDFVFDFPGLGWFALFVVPALLALEQIQRSVAMTPGVAMLAGLSVSALILLLRRENKTQHPLLPVKLLRQPSIWRSDALAACHGAALVSLITFMPVYLRVARGATASGTGLVLLPIAVGIGAGALITGRLVSRTGRTVIFPAVALIPGAGLLFWLALVHETMAMTDVAVLLAVLALLMGSVMNVVQVVAQDAAGPRMLGAAAGAVAFSRSVGAAFGTALTSMLMFSSLSIASPAAAEHFGALLAHGPAALEGLSAAAREGVTVAVASSFRYVFLLIAGFVAVGCALAWSVPMKRLS
ncbi:MAG: MFS transporter [Rhodospirillaceae bacterium]